MSVSIACFLILEKTIFLNFLEIIARIGVSVVGCRHGFFNMSIVKVFYPFEFFLFVIFWNK